MNKIPKQDTDSDDSSSDLNSGDEEIKDPIKSGQEEQDDEASEPEGWVEENGNDVAVDEDNNELPQPPSDAEETATQDQEKGIDDDDENDDDEDNADPDGTRVPVINPISFIKNKQVRKELFKKIKLAKNKQKRRERKERRKSGAPRNKGHTIESLRETDQTDVANLNDSENEELQKELELDDFSSYFAGTYQPKILITFSDNPNRRTRKFGLELGRIIPNALVKIRNRSSVKKMVKSAVREEYTDIIVVNEDRHKPNGILVIHLPDGPTFHFKLSNVKLTVDIKRSHTEISKHRPEVILTNFTTRLGLTVGRMLGALFHHDPEFKGRRVATFHNQRDFIFFRHHRYEFTKEGKRAKLRELGPRFTLKLRSVQEGTFDSKTGDYAWIVTNKRHAMEGRRRFYL